MKVSEIKTEDLWQHLRETPEDMGEQENREVEAMLQAAISFTAGYTGLSKEELDAHEDIAIAVLMLTADLYDNRQFQVDKNTMNRTVETILGMHCVNLL